MSDVTLTDNFQYQSQYVATDNTTQRDQMKNVQNDYFGGREEGWRQEFSQFKIFFYKLTQLTPPRHLVIHFLCTVTNNF